MSSLKYKIIKSKKQYNDYCRILEDLLFSKFKSQAIEDEIDILTLLIEKWDNEHYSLSSLDPVQLLKSFIYDSQLKSKDLVEILGISKGYVSDILNYKKGLSKAVIRKLSSHFRVSQEAFNRPYKLVTSANPKLAVC